MSVCDENDCVAWKFCNDPQCSCSFCGFGEFDEHDDDALPTTCPYVPILKLFAEVVEMADLQIMPHPPEHKHPLSREWIKVEFWVRRA